MDAFGQYVANLITASARDLAGGVVRRQHALAEAEPYAGRPFNISHEASLGLAYLAESLACNRPALLETHVAWLKVAYTSREIPLRLLGDRLHCTGEELQSTLPDAALGLALEHLSCAEQQLWDAPTRLESLLSADAPLVDLTRRYLLAVLENRVDDACSLVRDALRGGVDVRDVHEHVLGRAQRELGRMWQMNELNVAEEHVGTRITERVLTLISLERPKVERIGCRVAATSVTGNTHEIGLRVVADHFEMAGWESVLFGSDIPILDIVRGVQDFGADLLAISANMLHVRATAGLIATMRSMEETAEIPILVGGPPFNIVDDLWRLVGADASGCNGRQAVAAATAVIARA